MCRNGALREQFAADVRSGLCGNGRKRLPAKHLYDSVGTALFEAITKLPEYGLTRADLRLLRECAGQLPRHLTASDVIVAELGSGSGIKTRLLLDGLGRAAVRCYCPIDISFEALERCQQGLGSAVEVRPYHANYVEGVCRLGQARPEGAALLLLFLGSSIGNFDRQERNALLADLRSALLPGDHVLFGFDLLKPRERLLSAYDDPAGVTAAFNRNLLGRINRELSAEFDLASFSHLARFDEPHRRVEMHLVSSRSLRVPIPGADAVCNLRTGETIWTESSYKFTEREIRETMRAAGFSHVAQWVDDEWPLLEGLWTIREE